MKYTCFSLLLLSVFCHATTPVSEKFRHYGVIDGLSGSDITSICENGNFLWIATTDGLNRFDGRNFKVFKRDAASDNSLSENSIETLMFDSRGLLWIGLKTGGVDVYDPRKDKFIHIARVTGGELPNRVMSIFEDSEHNIWLGSWGNGVYKLTPDGERELSFRSENHFDGYIVSAITEIPAGRVWTGTYTGYCIHDLKSGGWDSLRCDSLVITSFLQDGGQNRLWCSTWGSGLVELSWEGDVPENIGAEFMYRDDIHAIYRLAGSRDRMLYLGTWGEGLAALDVRQPGGIRSMRKNAFPPPLIYALHEDRSGRLWIGTYGDGLYCYDARDRGISFIPADERDKTPASAGNIVPVGDSFFLAGTLGGGFYLCDMKKNSLVRKYGAPRGRAYENNALALYVDEDIVLAGHDGAGLLYAPVRDIHEPDAAFRTFHAPRLEKVTAIFRDTGDRVWLGTKQDGLMSVRYDAEKGTFDGFTACDILGHDEITGFVRQDSQHLWVASHAGLFLFDTQNNRPEEVSSEMIYCIEKDAGNDCLWIGSSSGISRMGLDGTRPAEHPFPAGLVPRGTVRDMMLDGAGNLWFLVAGRIFCFVESENSVREINVSALNGRPAISCAGVSVDGRPHLLFGSAADFIVLDPGAVFAEDTGTEVVFTELQIDHRTVNVGEKVYGRVALEEGSEYTRSLQLSHRCRWISFVMAETGSTIWKTGFQYRISGFGDTWQHLDLTRPITFSRLNPGEYTLQLRSFDGRDGALPCWSMHLSVSYPWWQTGRFYAGLALAALTLAALALLLVRRHYRKRQLQRLREMEKRKKEELLREKESFFAGLSHDLATPFSLIIAPANDLLRDGKLEKPVREKLEIIGKNATFLSDLFNTILDLKRAETSDLELREKRIEAVSFVRIITNAFDYLARSGNIRLSCHSEIPALHIVTDSVKLERIIYNLLSNAMKFTPAGGEVSVRTGLSDGDTLFITVADSGPGIGQENRERVFEKFYREARYLPDGQPNGLGLGLYVVRQFVSLLNGEIEVDSSPESGTRITIRLKPPITGGEALTAATEADGADRENGRTTILIVEDNSELRRYLTERLSGQFCVISVPGGEEALRAVGENLPEIVISDVMMPGMDGLSLTGKIKSNPLYADVFVILLTALSSPDDERKGYRAGADIYLKKPFDPETLVNQIVNIGNTRLRRRRQLLQQLMSPSGDGIEPDPGDEFLRRSLKIVEEHLMDADFRIDGFAAEMHLSKTVLHRKFRVVAGQTPNQFIRAVRLRRAAGMLLNSDYTVAEIAYLTGFNQSHYFIKCFREVYGETPSHYKKTKPPKG
ncbi:MAG: helix-turn-helix domain-containing protein [Tannerella sp.]|jgi:signal transduction histidine kinase/ligand-binding sensor domain-containing protein/DNA-binding response OmpR family regulator|nr:helix-turn-helix domain-containing protein [Tannerella sp.]